MATTSFRLMGFNILGVRFSSKVSWLLRRPRIVKRASRVLNDVDTDFASIYTFLECRQYEADYLKAELGWTDNLSSPLGCTIGIRRAERCEAEGPTARYELSRTFIVQSSAKSAERGIRSQSSSSQS